MKVLLFGDKADFADKFLRALNTAVRAMLGSEAPKNIQIGMVPISGADKLQKAMRKSQGKFPPYCIVLSREQSPLLMAELLSTGLNPKRIPILIASYTPSGEIYEFRRVTGISIKTVPAIPNDPIRS